MKYDGAKISKPGMYDRVPMDAYHGDLCVGPSISSSGLRTIFSASPAHYWVESYLNPEREERSDTKAFTLGRGAHHLLLGEDDFSTLFVMRPETLGGKDWHGNRTECKAWLASQAKAGRTVLLPEQVKAIRGMARSLAAHPLVRAGVLNGEIEQSLVWQDKATGVWLKARPDAIPNDSGDFADLKSSSHYGEDLDKDVSKYRYDVQAALTKWGAKAVLDLEMESYSFVFAGSEPPHCVDVLTLEKADIEAAEQDLRAALDLFAWCHENNNWIGPSGTQNDARPVRIPDWVRERAEYRRDFWRREMARAEAVNQRYGAEDYIGAG